LQEHDADERDDDHQVNDDKDGFHEAIRQILEKRAEPAQYRRRLITRVSWHFQARSPNMGMLRRFAIAAGQRPAQACRTASHQMAR
ncbi:hypothetical protein AB4144_44080, partial [Rhizobiaceae sp. 2RAB30]